MSSEVAHSWHRVCQLCERTLRSICNQTSPHFQVIVVCNHQPEINFTHPNINYLEVDLPLPELTKKGKTLDRGYKVLKGLQSVSGSKFTHAMVVDADDCISKHLVNFVMQNHHDDGWFIKKGYFYPEGKNIVYINRNFHNNCGSCNMIKYNLYNLQKNYIKEADFIYKYYGKHKFILHDLSEKGTKIEALPFKGAIYTIENGENYYNSNFNRLVIPENVIDRLKTLRNYRLLTNSIKDEFGLYKIDASNN